MAEEKFAVIRTGGKQYLVHEGDVLRIEKLDAGEGTPVSFGEVLLVADGDQVTVGTPMVAHASVAATLQKQGRDKKVTVVKYKPKVRYKKKQGHRQLFSEVKIEEIKVK